MLKMAKKPRIKTKTISIRAKGGAFNLILKHIKGSKEEFDFSELSALRQLLNNEKAKILCTIKTKNPESIYTLAKLLKRDFKAVRKDVKLLESFGFIKLLPDKTGKRDKLKPQLQIESLVLTFEI